MDNNIFDRANSLFADVVYGIVNIFMIVVLIMACLTAIAWITSWFINEFIPKFQKKNDDQHLT